VKWLGRRDRGRRIKVVRRRSDLVIGVVGVVLLTLLVDVLSAATPVERPVTTKLGHILIFAGVVWPMWNFAVKSKVTVWSTGLEVVNGYVRHWLPWSTVDFSFSTQDVGIRLKDGRQVKPLSTMGAPISAVFGNRHQRRTGDFFEEVRVAAAADDVGAVATRKFEFRLVSLGVILACMCFLAFVVE
jgi:hypothetical protein